MVPLGAPAVLSHTRLTTRFAFFSFVFIAASNDVKDANKRTKKNTRNHYANPLISKRILIKKKSLKFSWECHPRRRDTQPPLSEA
jgi:hypothetical protein